VYIAKFYTIEKKQKTNKQTKTKKQKTKNNKNKDKKKKDFDIKIYFPFFNAITFFPLLCPLKIILNKTSDYSAFQIYIFFIKKI
jgi:hypothetical protein